MTRGDIADLILVDPKTLAEYDADKHVQRVYRDEFSHEQLVNRSDDVVKLVMIGGQTAWENNAFSGDLGKNANGSVIALDRFCKVALDFNEQCRLKA